MHIFQDFMRQEGVCMHRLDDCHSAMDAQGAVSSHALVNIDAVVVHLEESCCIFPVQLQLETGKPQSLLPFTP